MGEPVTLSDCSRALDAIEHEIEELKRLRTETQRKIDALLTQGRMIKQLSRMV
jgi:prefoldin subunit 5